MNVRIRFSQKESEGGLEERRIGVMEEWRSGVLEEWRIGVMESWRIGVMDDRIDGNTLSIWIRPLAPSPDLPFVSSWGRPLSHSPLRSWYVESVSDHGGDRLPSTRIWNTLFALRKITFLCPETMISSRRLFLSQRERVRGGILWHDHASNQTEQFVFSRLQESVCARERTRSVLHSQCVITLFSSQHGDLL